MELKYHPEVRIEVREAARFYESRGGWVKHFWSLCEAQWRIVQRPETWPKVGRRVRRYVMARFRHHIVYSVVDDVVIIVAVAHDRRRPGYWRKRLGDL